ncbi:arginase family protein [Robertkochia solimangrovi]|uniref:arginase family protein n=1 Tax=Robertkochia solimangrovi TaxID=2213046 RepID=UPI00117BE28D|nr:arginase family protein [Robertkochia solimangrovi]TRZ45392.1 arginase [Robertkochia solimangrovi]
MPSLLTTYTLKSVLSLTESKSGEKKLGEIVELLNPDDSLEHTLADSQAKYVMFGIPEDLGILANEGTEGSRNTWEATLKAFVNLQGNSFIKAPKVLLLGHMNLKKYLDEIDALDGKDKTDAAADLTVQLDKEVTNLVHQIVASGKKPIIIGGGQNNSYGIIKGSSLAMGGAINAINISPVAGFRKRNHRHHKNGFSYAFYEGFLNRYALFGMQENHVPKKVIKRIKNEDRIKITTYEDLFIRREKGFDYELLDMTDFIKPNAFGVEIAFNVIPIASLTSKAVSGFDLDTVRHMVYKLSKPKNAIYLHISEAPIDTNDQISAERTGNAIATLISDFIRK